MATTSQNRLSFPPFVTFAGAWYRALIGYDSRRKRMLGTLWIKQKSFNTAGREITALEASRSPFMQPVIFLHGNAGTAVDWQWFLQKAADRFNIVALDRPGYGPADRLPPDIKRDMPILVDILRQYVTEEHKPIIVGHALGGAIAASLAANHPDLVGGLVLVSPDIDPATEQLTSFEKSVSALPFSLIVPRLLRNGAREQKQAAEFLETLKPQLTNITCRISLLHSANDRLVLETNVDYIRNNCTRAAALNRIALKSGGHFLNKTKPREILKALEAL